VKAERAKQPNLAENKQRVLLVDDHPILCEGLAQKINSEPDLMVCGQVRDAHSALDAIDRLRPDIAVVDLALGGDSGVELIKDLKVRHPRLPALVLSMHDEAFYAERSLRAGAKGYVMKQEDTAVLLRAIRQVLQGKVYLSEKVKDAIVNRLGGNAPDGGINSRAQQLSDRELEVFQLIGDGYATHEIADHLHLSIKTVATHRENIKRKLKLKSSEELGRSAIHWQRYRNFSGNDALGAPSRSPKKSKASASKAANR
jgi:DNA-binding NarL/FixJ family response regulator